MNKMSKFNLLVSLEKKTWPARLTKRQQQETRIELKKAAKEALVYASSNFRNGKSEQAKSALAHAVDCLSIVEPLDEEVQDLLRVCYDQAAAIHKNIRHEQRNEDIRRTLYLSSNHSKNEILLDFDHEQGLFRLKPEVEMVFNYDLKFALSKINGVLFSFNNQQTAQSLLSKLKIYKTTIFVSGLLLLLTLFVFFAEKLLQTQESWLSALAIFLVSSTFLCPLIMIYFKNPDQEIVTEYEENIRKEIIEVNRKFQRERLLIKVEFLPTNQLRVFKLPANNSKDSDAT